jgi:hypothetical protein
MTLLNVGTGSVVIAEVDDWDSGTCGWSLIDVAALLEGMPQKMLE